jgi:hypothetical protein
VAWQTHRWISFLGVKAATARDQHALRHALAWRGTRRIRTHQHARISVSMAKISDRYQQANMARAWQSKNIDAAAFRATAAPGG